ncbi:MAG: sigma-54 dependent transcriptional regulator [Pseudomonadota bacterium]
MVKILVVDDEVSILETLDMYFTEKGVQVFKAETGEKGFSLFCDHKPDIVILDIHLPDCNGLDLLNRIRSEGYLTKVIMITAYHDMETTIRAMKHGAYDYIHKPLDADVVDEVIHRALSILEAERETPILEAGPKTPNADVIIGSSDEMRKIFKTIGLLCQNRATVLIQGETGTGKELIARMIHRNSLYDQEPFITLDCSSVVESLLESELFGHMEGAFTGARHTKKGKIELAGNGTLFLDEIGELPYHVQGKLLGFLQRHEYMRVGGQEVLKARCRIIAATNRDLFSMVHQNKFRQDLFYRLRVVIIQVPPLRERLSDIQELVNHFLQKINLEMGSTVSKLQDGVMERLMAHPWTGNIRELENLLVEAVVRARGSVLLLDEIEDILSSNHITAKSGQPPNSLPNMEKDHIQKTLDKLGWRRTEAAHQLKISLPTLRSKIRKYGITPPETPSS